MSGKEFGADQVLGSALRLTDSAAQPNQPSGGHQSVAISRTGQPAHVALPGVHRVASLLKRWLTGTLHYGYSIDQLDYYLDEFTFRFNRRTARSRGLLFYRLLHQAVVTDRHPYREFTVSSGVDPLPPVLASHRQRPATSRR
jgi:ISXO2-like transposase domain